MRIRLIIIVMILLALFGCKNKEKEAPKPLQFASAEGCADCHESIYNEWKASMHAKSAPMNDKVHAAVFKMTGNDIKTGSKYGKVPVCVKCHVPIAALDGEKDLTKKPIYAEGVTCTFCHKIKGLKKGDDRGLGAHAYEFYTDNTFASGMKDAKKLAHGTASLALYKKSEYCGGCHNKRSNSKGVNVCNTYEEYETSRFSKTLQCQNCHMKPSREGLVADASDKKSKLHDHGSTGGHNIEQVKSGVSLKLNVKKDKNIVQVTLKNKNTGHNMPTAAPLRQMYLKVTQLDAKGDVIAENYKDNPKEDPNALFVLAFEDAKGNVGVPPWKAVKIAFDKRLKPNEIRLAFYDLAGDKVKKVRAELYYRLIPEKLAKGNDFDEYTTKAHLIAQEEVTIK